MPSGRNPESLLPLTPALFHVLVALADGRTHGYAIMKDVEQLTRGGVRLSTGTLYGIIKRLLNEALQRAEESPLPDPSELLDGVYASPEDLDTPHHK